MTAEVCANCGAPCDDVRVCSACKCTPYCGRECQRRHWPKHKKICKLLNAGKGEQFAQPGADEFTEERDIDALHHVMVMHTGPKPSGDMYILFKGASRGDTKRQVAARAKKMRDLARVLILQNKMDTIHQVFYRAMKIMLRDEPWRVEQPYSPLLALLQSGLDLSHVSLLGNSGASHLCSLAQESSATSTSRNRNQVTIGRQMLEIGGADPNLLCGSGHAFPLYDACYSNQPTNLEFIELLLEHGADRNMECQGRTAIMGAFDMSLDAIKLLITYEHANCPPIDINKSCPGFNATALDFTRMNSLKFTRFRDEVAISGKAATNCYKTWTTVEPFNVQIEKLEELEALLLSKGAVEGNVEKCWYEAYVKQPDMMPRRIGLKIQPHYGVKGFEEVVKESHAKLPFDVSCLIGVEDLIHGKRSPDWYRRNPARIEAGSTRMLQAFEGRPHLHCALNGVAPKVGLKVKLYLFLPNDALACLAGQVAEALPVPTEKDLKRTKRTVDPTLLYKRPCPVTFCQHGADCILSRTGSYDELLQKFGAVHGQEVKCRLKFTRNLGDGRDESVVAFFAGYSKFDVTLRFIDHMENKWKMASITPVE